ncbi:putative methyl-accepting chemotaxis protein YoaH [Geobacter sp. OR-1]|uniref:methyl-accepting chemotaxis protein n=1 Tax=Geobacter sp. OR-1 TaxID=1266765 RepID=UPI0005430F26|nr:methyl-accepting chemotaxis protein [Geobacter sp. OR-1]GAM08650.1 putative methyl-accepting chemotaxis protein YoaH [Geobacter sp. OR-1]
MKIKTKLILNMVIGAVAVWTIVITSVFGMNFIKGKLSYLTQKSTPYQMRTVEFQKELQGATTDLVKVNAARTMQEYQTFRAEAEKSLNSVKNAELSLEEMSGNKLETHKELNKIAQELFTVVANKLASETAANNASLKVAQRLKESSSRLKELDQRIRILQTGRTNSFAAALRDTGQFSGKLRSVEELRNLVKDLQLVLLEIQNAQRNTVVLIAKGKLNAANLKISKNEYLQENDTIAADCKAISAKIEEVAKLQSAALSQKTDEARGKATAAGKETFEKVNTLFLTLDQEASLANEKFGIESKKQGTIFTQSNVANSILMNNSELVSLGMSLEGLTTKLFTLESVADIDKLAPEITAVFGKAEKLTKNLDDSMKKIGVSQELKILRGVQGTLTGIRSELFAANGIIATLKTHLNAEDQAVKIGDKLREIVVKQGEKGKETVTAAKGDQEKAIASVNKMVATSITLLIVIGSVAAIIGTFFGIWGFRSVIRPLTTLVTVADSVADGNLHISDIKKGNDEFGQVQAAMDKMVHNLRQMVTKISDSTATVASSSEELSATANELEKNSHVQTSGIETTVTAMTEMVQTIQDVSGNAMNTADSAGKMKQIAQAGQKALDSTSKELFAFADVVRQSAEKTEALGVKSEAIDEIVEMIKDIADQTNLLALNASIEAARAGDMGRGFAVVADSVRQLAHRTIDSSEEIGRTVKEMREEVQSSVTVMKKERESIDGIIQHIDNTLQSMGQIVTHVEQVFDMVQTIATATEEQSATADGVNRTMVGINDITRQLTVSVTEIKGTSDNFARLAADLQQMVGWFKL